MLNLYSTITNKKKKGQKKKKRQGVVRDFFWALSSQNYGAGNYPLSKPVTPRETPVSFLRLRPFWIRNGMIVPDLPYWCIAQTRGVQSTEDGVQGTE